VPLLFVAVVVDVVVVVVVDGSEAFPEDLESVSKAFRGCAVPYFSFLAIADLLPRSTADSCICAAMTFSFSALG